jgi:hypothetical protein
MQKSNVNRIRLIQGYEPNKVKDTLELVLRQRKNEFRELADALKIPTNSEEWEIIILKFCLDFEDCFEGKSVTEIAHIQTTANTIYHEFHNIYGRI